MKIALIGGVTAAALLGSSVAHAFVREPFVKDATESTVTIAWEAGSAGGTQRLVWGAGVALDQQLDATLVSNRFYEATVTGLPPSSGFSYRVVSHSDESDVGSFITAPDRPEPFRFGVYGDNRSDASGHAAVVDSIIPLAPDLLISTGDLVADTDYEEFFEIERDLLRHTVMFPSPGNHDVPSEYQYAFNRPNYYSFRWGNAFFVSINTDGNYSSGSTQQQWVRAQLEAASQDETVDWIFAYHHHPVYSSGHHGNTSAVINALNPLYKEYGVDVVFTGHDHNYERIERDGVVYIVSGGGGVTPRPMKDAVTGSVISESTRHVVMADVDGGILKMTAYRPDGSVIDTKSITKGPASNPGEPGGLPGEPDEPGEPEPGEVSGPTGPINPRNPGDPAGSNGGSGGGCSVAGAPAAATTIGGMLAVAFAVLGLVANRRRRS